MLRQNTDILRFRPAVDRAHLIDICLLKGVDHNLIAPDQATQVDVHIIRVLYTHLNQP